MRIALVSIKGIKHKVTKQLHGVMSLTFNDAEADSLTYLKLYGGTEQNSVPSGYTQLEYTQANGDQYIDTGVYGTNNTKIEVKYMHHIASMINTSGRLLGARYTSGTNRRGFCLGTNNGRVENTTKIFGQVHNSTLQGSNVSIGNRMDISLDKNNLTVDGTDYTVSGVDTFTTPFTLKLFAFEQSAGSGETGTIGCGIGRCAYLKIYEAGVLVRYLIPAKNSNDVVGMYDTVSGTFFENAGTGTFTAGPTATPTPTAPIDIVSNNGAIKVRHQSGLPLRYTLIEWLRSTGGIEISDFKTKDTQTFNAKWYRVSTNAQYIYSSDTSSSGTTNTTAYITSSGNWRFDGEGRAVTSSTSTLYESTQNKDGVRLNGTQVGTYGNVSSFISTNNLRIFSSVSTSPLRIYSLNVMENGVKVLDLVPVLDTVTNEYGVYDLVGGQFYTNEEATFTAGPTVSDPIEIYTTGPIETVEDSLGNTATAEMLLKVGDYQDVQEVISGSVTRRVGVKVLDGTENWTLRQTSSGIATMNLASGYCPVYFGSSEIEFIVSHFIFQRMVDGGARTSGSPIGFYAYYSNGQPNTRSWYCNVDATTYPTASDFKQRLADQYANGTPVIVVYPLATETTESVTPQTINVKSGSNTIEITQAGLDDLELEIEYQGDPL